MMTDGQDEVLSAMQRAGTAASPITESRALTLAERSSCWKCAEPTTRRLKHLLTRSVTRMLKKPAARLTNFSSEAEYPSILQ